MFPSFYIKHNIAKQYVVSQVLVFIYRLIQSTVFSFYNQEFYYYFTINTNSFYAINCILPVLIHVAFFILALT